MMKTLETSFDRMMMLLQQLKSIVEGNAVSSNWRGTWATGIAYSVRDLVVGPTMNWYSCLRDHSSGTFTDDVSSGKWMVVLDTGDITTAMTTATQAAEDAVAAAATADAAAARATLIVSTASVHTIASNQTLTAYSLNIITASCALTLPSSPAVGSVLSVYNKSGTLTVTISGGAQKINGLAEVMTIDILEATVNLEYSGATYGWIVL
jgi:hypothetical protein